MADVSTLKEEKPENFIAAFGPQLNEVFSEILYCILIKYSRLNQRFVDVASFWTLWIVLIHAHFSASLSYHKRVRFTQEDDTRPDFISSQKQNADCQQSWKGLLR